MNPKISIIVPLYNKVNEVERAIDSIFAQTIQDFELIIVDGGSTDGSLDVIKKYERDSRYQLVHQVSKGVSSGRNEGMFIAKTDIIAFLDADDEWLPDFLEQILTMRINYPNAGLYGTAYIPTYDLKSQTLPLCEIQSSPWVGIISSYFRSTALARCPPFSPSCVAIPKSTFEHIGGFNPSIRMGEDTELWGRIALKYPIAYTSKPCAKYHWIANAKATDTYIPIRHHPFFRYIQQLPRYELEQYDKLEDLRLYLEYEELNMAYINLITGEKKLLKENLDYVESVEFQKRKKLFIFLSILPRSLVKHIPRIKRLTLDKMRCLLS